MTPPNIAAIAASLQTSLQNCSLDHHPTNTAGGSGFVTSSSSSSSISNHHSSSSSDATLELNSNISLPYHWEQCLDLKTGEVYYINWRTGMKVKEDPKTADHGFYSNDEDEEDDESPYDEEDDESPYDDDEDESRYDEEGSSSESSSKKHNQKEEERIGGNVLVVAGCKSCLTYFMLAKQVEECPKCKGQLLHFNRSVDNA